MDPRLENRLDFVDLLKAIAIYFVVLYHFYFVSEDFLSESNPVVFANYYIKSLLSTCVPVFFFVNGLLLLKKKEIDVIRHAKKVLRICILTVVWSFITLGSLSLLRNESLSISQLIMNVHISLRMHWNNHLWFLGTIVVIYIFYPFIHLAYYKSKPVFYFFFISILLFTFGRTFLDGLFSTISYFSNRFTTVDFDFNYGGIFNPVQGIHGYALVYFMLGGILFEKASVLNSKKYKNLSMIGILLSTLLLFLYGIIYSHRTGVIWDSVWNGYDTVFTLLNVCFLFVMVIGYRSKGRIGYFIGLIGQNSLGIYLIHILVLELFRPWYFRFEIPAVLWVNILYAFCVLLISLGLTLFFLRIPLLKELFRFG